MAVVSWTMTFVLGVLGVLVANRGAFHVDAFMVAENIKSLSSSSSSHVPFLPTAPSVVGIVDKHFPSFCEPPGRHPIRLCATNDDPNLGSSDSNVNLLEEPPPSLRTWKETQQESDSSITQHCQSTLPLSSDQSDTDVPIVTQTRKEEDNANMARLLLIGAAALYGTNFSVVKMLGQTDMSVALSATLRFGLAALATLPWLFGPNNGSSSSSSDNNEKSSDPDESSGIATTASTPALLDPRIDVTLRGMEVGLWNSFGYMAQAIGLGTTLASKSAFLCSLAVVVVPLLDFATGKRLERKQLIGIVLAILGVGVLELGGLNASDLALTSGDLASLVQPLAFGVAFWRMETAMHKYPNQAKRATAAQLLAVFLASAAYGAVTNPKMFDATLVLHYVSQPTILLSLFWTGCITTALTIYMESTALQSLSASETTLVLSTEPLWGTAFAAVTLGEKLGPDTAIGAVLILVACLYSTLGWNGIQSLVTGGGQEDSSDSSVSPSSSATDAEKDKAITQNDENHPTFSRLSRTGFFAAAGSTFLGSMQEAAWRIQEILGDLLPPGPPPF